jgi:transketolase
MPKSNIISVTNSFTDCLIDLAKKNKKIIVLDADLSDDVNLNKFKKYYPNRFIQNGIAEQDMVSMAGGMALTGLLPVVNSFASFLTSRANEQIYNNATENTKIIYMCLYAGSIPAGAGKSHQSLRDISVLSSIPNMSIFHPYNHMETKQILKHCLSKNVKNNCAIRLSIGPVPQEAPLIDKKYKFLDGQGFSVAEGDDAILFTYGQTMLTEAYKASLFLKQKNIKIEVVNTPCINNFNKNWLKKKITNKNSIFFLDDHNINGGLGDLMISFLAENNLLKDKKITKFGFRDFPACGTTAEVLSFHKLDYKNISNQIISKIKND